MGRNLPFRQLNPTDNDDSTNHESVHHSALHSGPLRSDLKLRPSQQLLEPASPPHSHLIEPELLTASKEIEVVLGDTVVLPCKVAHLGKIKSVESSLFVEESDSVCFETTLDTVKNLLTVQIGHFAK